MPTYEYACRSCGEHLEVVQSFKDDPLTTCPGCGGQLRKVFGAIGIAFKGSGFYKTDNRTGGDKKQDSAASKPDASKPDASKPDASKPGTSKTGASKTGASKSDGSTTGSSPTAPKSEPKAAASS